MEIKPADKEIIDHKDLRYKHKVSNKGIKDMNKQAYEHTVGLALRNSESVLDTDSKIGARAGLSKQANPLLDDITQQGSLDPNKSYGYPTPHTSSAPKTTTSIKPKFTSQDEPYKGDIFGRWRHYNKNPLYNELVPEYSFVNETYKGRTAPYGPKAMQPLKDMTRHVPTQKMWDFMNYDYALRKRMKELGYPDLYKFRRLAYGPFEPDYQYDTKIRPADLITARTGDPNYINKTYDEVNEYLKGNPEWSQTSNGSWYNKKYGITYDLNRWKRQANTPAVARFNEGSTTSGFYVPPQDIDKVHKKLWASIAKDFKMKKKLYDKYPDMAVKLGMPRSYDEYTKNVFNSIINNPARFRSNGVNIGMTPYTIKPSNNTTRADYKRMFTDSSVLESMSRLPEHEQIASVAGHELNHFAQNGTLSRDEDKSPVREDNYAKKLVELAQAGAVFQQQFRRLTGKRITNPEELDTGIRYALEHIEDFDPESRRFIDHALSLMREDADTKDRLRRDYKGYIKLNPDNPLKVTDIDDYRSREPGRLYYDRLYDQLKALMPLLGNRSNNPHSSTVLA